MRKDARTPNIDRAYIFRGGSLQRLTEDSPERQIAGKKRRFDSYVLRVVAFTPDAYYGCIVYSSVEEARLCSATLRSLAYHYDYPVHICWRNDRIYILKAVDLDG